VTKLELRQERDVGALFRDALSVFGRHALLFIALSAAVVIPTALIVEGIGLEMLTGSYDESPPLVQLAIPTAVEFLVVTPIIAAICTRLPPARTRRRARSSSPASRRSRRCSGPWR
jgi:uncharacterized BrkB/YihY/UPF0761 family membrane protein